MSNILTRRRSSYVRPASRLRLLFAVALAWFAVVYVTGYFLMAAGQNAGVL